MEQEQVNKLDIQLEEDIKEVVKTDKITIGDKDGEPLFTIELRVNSDDLGKMAGMVKKYDITKIDKDDVMGNQALIEFLSIGVVNFDETIAFLYKIQGDKGKIQVVDLIIKKLTALVPKTNN